MLPEQVGPAVLIEIRDTTDRPARAAADFLRIEQRRVPHDDAIHQPGREPSVRMLPQQVRLAVLINVLLLLLAFRSRDLEAPCYLLCVGLLLAAWWLNKTEVYEFHGVLFPLTAAGACA